MSSVTKLPNQEARYDEASLWIAKMERRLSSEEEEQLQSWMGESQENRDLVLQMAEQWDKMDSLSRLSAIFPHQPASQSLETKNQGFFQKLANWFNPLEHPGYALSLLLIIAAAILYRPLDNPISSPADDRIAYETAVGEQSSILLADGSHMRLNTDTLVQVTFTSEQRLLNLIRGELNIDVAHDQDRPLRVQANGRVVEAVGTAFNVEITETQEVELVVTEGKVVVTLAQHSPRSVPSLTSSTLASNPTPKPIAVSAGHEILLGSTAEELKEIEPQEALVKLSWQEGNLIFRGESLEEAMSEVGRYTTVEFVFLDEQSKHVRIAGLFKAGDTANLLSALRENFNVTYEWDGADRVLLSSL